VVAARRLHDAREAVAALHAAGAGELLPEELDVADEGSVHALAARLGERGLPLDVLVSNAGLYSEGGLFELESAELERVLAVNLWGPLWCAQAFVPGMRARGHGRIVHVSSGSGSLTDRLPGPAAYSLSKAFLNALTVRLAAELADVPDVKVNACCPGWVRTRMGGPEAELSVEEGADTIVWLATLPSDGPSGGFFRDRKPIPW
jgi:NAD(P)-dependent dehydrogenase (short-subunit alcohol dehydrogenase family)